MHFVKKTIDKIKRAMYNFVHKYKCVEDIMLEGASLYREPPFAVRRYRSLEQSRIVAGPLKLCRRSRVNPLQFKGLIEPCREVGFAGNTGGTVVII